ncbi:hypothetical protein D3C81_863050 [compost metagenome]
MDGLVRRRGVGEVGADRMPVRTQQCRAQAHHHTDRQLRGLTAAGGPLIDHLFTDDHRLAFLLDMNRQGVIEQMPVLHDHLQGIAQGALVAEQQADFTEIRQLSRLGHAQAESLAVAGPGGFFQQGDHAGDRDTSVGVVKLRRAEPHLEQQRMGVEAQMAGHLKVVGQARGTD